jgi:hypothetical protein
MVQPETRRRSTGYGNAAGRELNSIGVPSLGSSATRSTKNLFFRFSAGGDLFWM